MNYELRIMKKTENLFLSIFIFLILNSIFLIPQAEAARLYFEPQELTVGTEGEFLVAVNIDAQNSINALSVALLISPGFTPYDTSDGNSIINFWLDKPNWDEATRLLTFSGIIPGGFSGKGARLLTVNFRVQPQGDNVRLSFDKEKTEVFLNAPDGVRDSLEFDEITIPISKGKENLPIQIPDKDPPEDFKPEIARDPNIFDGQWFLVFATQDKGSGIAYYVIHESTRKEDTARIDAKKWSEAESPYALKDQNLRSYIYVKAVDRDGNERIAVVEPRYPMKWYREWRIYSIIILGVFLGYIIWKIKRKRLFSA